MKNKKIQPKTASVAFRCTASFKKAIIAEANKLGITVSEYCENIHVNLLEEKVSVAGGGSTLTDIKKIENVLSEGIKHIKGMQVNSLEISREAEIKAYLFAKATTARINSVADRDMWFDKQLSVLAGKIYIKDEVLSAPVVSGAKKIKSAQLHRTDVKFIELLKQDISKLTLTPRYVKALRNVRINTIYELITSPYGDGFNRVANIGFGGQYKIIEELARHGLKPEMDLKKIKQHFKS